MKRVSPENTSPLIMECERCGHQEGAEAQFSPPWPPEKEETAKSAKKEKTEWSLFSGGVPVTVGKGGEDGEPVHFGCVLLVILGLVLLGLAVWLVLR